MAQALEACWSLAHPSNPNRGGLSPALFSRRTCKSSAALLVGQTKRASPAPTGVICTTLHPFPDLLNLTAIRGSFYFFFFFFLFNQIIKTLQKSMLYQQTKNTLCIRGSFLLNAQSDSAFYEG